VKNELLDRAEPDAERLARALERLAMGEPLDGLMANLDREPELAALVALVSRMSLALPAEAPTAMRRRQEAVLRQRMTAMTSGSHAAAPRRRVGAGLPGWFVLPRAATALVALAMAFGGLVTTGAVVAAASSLPGDPLYGVKRAAEITRLAVTFDRIDRVALRLAFAGERLDEIRALIDRGVMPAPEVIEQLIALYDASLVEAAEASLPAAAIQDRRAASAGVLSAMGRAADPALQAWLESAAARLIGATPADPPAAPTPIRGADDGGDPHGTARRAGPTVARPSEALATVDASLAPTSGHPATLVTPPPNATVLPEPMVPAPGGPTAAAGSGGEPVAPPVPTSSEPAAEPTSVPPAPTTSSIEEQRRRDLTNTPAPPPPGASPGHGRPQPPRP